MQGAPAARGLPRCPERHATRWRCGGRVAPGGGTSDRRLTLAAANRAAYDGYRTSTFTCSRHVPLRTGQSTGRNRRGVCQREATGGTTGGWPCPSALPAAAVVPKSGGGPDLPVSPRNESPARRHSSAFELGPVLDRWLDSWSVRRPGRRRGGHPCCMPLSRDGDLRLRGAQAAVREDSQYRWIERSGRGQHAVDGVDGRCKEVAAAGGDDPVSEQIQAGRTGTGWEVQTS
jgi:hypothetical protein